MAMVLDSFIKRCRASLQDFAGQDACAALGVGDDVRALLATLSRIDAIVSHDERRRILTAKVDAWVAQVKDAMYDIDDAIDVCVVEGGKILDDDDRPPTPKVRCFSCFKPAGPRKFRHEIGFTIRDIDLRLREVEEEMPRLPAGSRHSDAKRDWFSHNSVYNNFYYTVKPQAVGSQVQKAVGGLVPRMLREGKKKVDVFAIVGAVGIGKTTLAREIYNDDRITENFPICVWVKMSKDLSEVAFLKKIITGAGANVGDTENREDLLGLLSSALSKRFLIVLDDLDNAGICDNLLKDSSGDGVARGRILITTRTEEVATSMKATIHRVDKMDTKNAWELLCKQVDPERDSEELAALKDCFLHCSLYPEECPIQRFDLVRHWIAEGIVNAGDNKLLEESAEEYYIELISRNLLQPDPDNVEQCWITHDLLRSLARFLIEDENILIYGQQKLSTSLSKPRHLTLCNMENSLEDPISLKQQMSIRSVMFFKSPNVRAIDILVESAPCLRVLDLSKTSIEALPKSIGNLVHLRYLNLDGTEVRDIPSSIGFLMNLQTLSLQGCQRLQRLPWSIKALLELRCLRLEGASLSYVPKGVGELKHLNYLSGLIIGHDNNGPEGCDLDDLKALSELRHLHIESLDRATSGAIALANKPFLKDLYLSEQAPVTEEQQQKEEQESQENKDEKGKEEDEGQKVSNGQCSGEKLAEASEKIWNELTPPKSLEKLVIKNYKGVRFPSWIKGPKLGTSFPSLALLDLENCMSCTKLPSLGLLNQLQFLQISNADSIVTISSEFLGTTVDSPGTSFPKLQVLKLRNMKKLEEWSLTVEETQILLPRLKSLHIQSCPKLKALPEGLKHVALSELHVEGAYSLTEIRNLPKLSDELHLKDNKALQRISNLPMLRSLIIDDCSKLKHVAGLDALQHLRLVFPPSTETFYFEELIIFWSIAFPRWLEQLIQKCKGLRRFELQCSLSLLRSCLDGGKNWHIVQQIPEVRIISCDGNRYIRYNKNRRIYETNAQSEE
ncbi:hypothetical protein PVAP13_4KG385703 [Panicum virgatum]|uniref:Uncharacterized protein n=1 Tax=Panicum virgatum TaxID=38727 RepID=A0A8T0U2D2_PANVG|nr:hypothetical protein PVAP13_4KG385703 [Panicum virgatum]